jgi:hypothetical protein
MQDYQDYHNNKQGMNPISAVGLTVIPALSTDESDEPQDYQYDDDCP